MSQEIANVLDDLAARFGTTGVRLWEELVKYEIATTTAAAFLFPIGAYISYRAALRLFTKATNAEYEAEALWYTAGIVTTLFCAILLVSSFSAVHDLVGVLASPEAATLRGLLP
jgi:uncharacterized membrane protein HdeD (DUF308 family)